MSIIQDVLDGNWSKLKTDLEKRTSDKVMERVNDKKVDVLAKINGVSRNKMQEIISINSKKLNEDINDEEDENDEVLDSFVEELRKEIDKGTYWEDAYGVVEKKLNIDPIKVFGFDVVENRFKDKFGKEPAEWQSE
ncbi:MAG: hypothetical protein ACOCZ5_00065 [bacterium]